MKSLSILLNTFKLVAVALILTGCAALQPFPQAARSGDTIALGVGPLVDVKKPNTKVYFTSDADGVPRNITTSVRSIFNLYADRTSLAYSPNYGYVDAGHKYIHHEPWETVIVIDLPLGLPVGPGHITYQTTASQPTALLEPGVTGPYPDLNTLSLPLEILPGTGTEAPSPFEYALSSGAKLTGDLNALTPQRQALISPPVEDTGSIWGSTYGAIEFSISLPMLDNDCVSSATEDSIRVVAQDVSNFTKSKATMAWAYDGAVLKVMFISSSGNLRYFEPRFSVIAETADFITACDPLTVTPPTVDSVKYYDINGVEIFTGPVTTDYNVKLFGRYVL